MAEEIVKYNDREIQIRDAKKEDMKAVSEMFLELVDFHKLRVGRTMTVEELQRDGFEMNPPAFGCKVAERRSPGASAAVGYATYFYTYSSYEGRAMMLQELVVTSAERRRGVGERLFDAVVQEANSTGCTRLDFLCAEWNPARFLYEGKGCINITETQKWHFYRLRGDALKNASPKSKQTSQ